MTTHSGNVAVSGMFDVVSLKFYASTPSLWKLHDVFLEPVFWRSATPLVDSPLQGICIGECLAS
jgi:hypothetical protein